MNKEARRRRLDSPHAQRQLDRIYKRDKAICWLCNRHVERVDASRDHLKKFSECTKEEARSIANMRLAHALCNNARDQGLPLPENPSLPKSQQRERRGMKYRIGDAYPVLQNVLLELQGMGSESN